MKITDLEHIQFSTDINRVKGSLAAAALEFETLALGMNNSETIGTFETLATSSPGTNISAISETFTSIAE